jgi:hypothetical protein
MFHSTVELLLLHLRLLCLMVSRDPLLFIVFFFFLFRFFFSIEVSFILINAVNATKLFLVHQKATRRCWHWLVSDVILFKLALRFCLLFFNEPRMQYLLSSLKLLRITWLQFSFGERRHQIYSYESIYPWLRQNLIGGCLRCVTNCLVLCCDAGRNRKVFHPVNSLWSRSYGPSE